MMTPESFHALIIDHHFGELTPDVAELLQTHLDEHPEAEAERRRILVALDATGRATDQFPRLIQINPAPVQRNEAARRGDAVQAWLKAAAVVAFAAMTGSIGYVAGRSSSTSSTNVSPKLAAAPPLHPSSSPWARYRMAPSPIGGGFRVIRIDSPHSPRTSEE